MDVCFGFSNALAFVKNFNFEDGILTVHSKGDKDRTVPVPQTIMPELKRQLAAVSTLYDKDIESGYSGIFLFDSLEKKISLSRKGFHLAVILSTKGAYAGSDHKRTKAISSS